MCSSLGLESGVSLFHVVCGLACSPDTRCTRVTKRRRATAVPACSFGIAAVVHALITSPLWERGGCLRSCTFNFSPATARPRQVSCCLSLCFNSARSSNDPTEPCPSQSGVGAEATVLGQPFNCYFLVSRCVLNVVRSFVCLNLFVLTQIQRQTKTPGKAWQAGILHSRLKDLS